jgi:hypothetical protein
MFRRIGDILRLVIVTLILVTFGTMVSPIQTYAADTHAIALVCYQFHDDDSSNAIMTAIKAAMPAILIDNSAHSLWGKSDVAANYSPLGSTNCDPTEYTPLGIKVYGYLTSGYEDYKYPSVPDSQPNDIDNLTDNQERIAAMAADGVTGVFLDEVWTMSGSCPYGGTNTQHQAYVSAIRSTCNSYGLELIINTGMSTFDPWLFSQCEYVMTDEGYDGTRSPTSTEAGNISKVIVETLGIDNASDAANRTNAAYSKGFYSHYTCNTYTVLPSWLGTYILLLDDPSSPPTNQTHAVSSNASDGYVSAGTLYNTQTWFIAGNNTATSCNAFFRFTGFNVPAGANITSATIRYVATQWNAGTNITLRLDDTPNSPEVTSASNWTSRTLTSNYTLWTSGYGDYAWHYTPSFASAVQEVVDSYGNMTTFQVAFKNEGSATNMSMVGDTYDLGYAPELSITFTSDELPVQPTPTFNPVAGAVAWGTNVTISSSGADAIYYTINGTTPTPTCTNQAITPLQINSAVTVKALAVRSGYTNSNIGSAAYTQAAATTPSNVVLAVGSTAPVGNVTNVAIPAAGGTDYTGRVTGWVTSTHDKIKFTVTNGGSATSNITINSVAYTSGNDYTIAAASNLTVAVNTTETGKSSCLRTFVISVSAQDDATVPTNVTLAIGTVNPVSSVTNVAIPVAGGTDYTGRVTGWIASTQNRIKFTVTDGGAASSNITIDSVAYTSGTNYAIATAANLTVVVTTSEAGKNTVARSFIISVTEQLDATTPSVITLAVGSINPVTGVTNVVIPAKDGIDYTGRIIGWTSSTHDRIKFTVTDAGGSSSITINSGAYTSGADYVIGAASNLTVVVSTSEAGKTTVNRTFIISVTAAESAGIATSFSLLINSTTTIVIIIFAAMLLIVGVAMLSSGEGLDLQGVLMLGVFILIGLAFIVMLIGKL